MATLQFYYSVMNGGKSSALLQLNFSLKEVGFSTLLLKSKIDTRTKNTIKSRIGLEEECSLFPDLPLTSLKIYEDILEAQHILVDEAQFLNKEEVEFLTWLVDSLDKNVYCFGLRTSYTGELFEGSAALFALADNLIELPLLYSDGNKCLMHLRYIDGNPVFDGDPIHVGDIKEDYESVSRKHYYKIMNERKIN